MKNLTSLVVILGAAAVVLTAEDSTRNTKQPKTEILFWPSPTEMHKGHVEEFISHPGFGFRRVMTPYESPTEFTHNGERYQLKRVDLIGIAEHSSPVAFMSRFRIPTKADFTNGTFQTRVDRREMTAFETNAVAQLSKGKNLVVDLKQHAIVGAIRARAECVKCHEVKSGALLGALSYLIVPSEINSTNELRLQRTVMNSIQEKTVIESCR